MSDRNATEPRCDVCGGSDPPRTPYWRDNQNRTCDPCEARIQQHVEIAMAERLAEAAQGAAPLEVVAVIESFRYSEPLIADTEPHRMWKRNEKTLDAILARLSEGAAPRQDGAQAAEWHRYLHQEGMLVEDEGEECGPWHHRVFIEGAAPRAEGLDEWVARFAERNPKDDLDYGYNHAVNDIVRELRTPTPGSEPAPTVPNVVAVRASCEWVEANIAPKRCDNEGVSDCWRCNTVFLARTLARLSRPSDERVPESEER